MPSCDTTCVLHHKTSKCPIRPVCPLQQRKLQRQESVVEEKDLTSVKITCVFCGRKRKKGLSRSALFCTKHCQTRWQDSHPGETPSPGVHTGSSLLYGSQIELLLHNPLVLLHNNYCSMCILCMWSRHTSIHTLACSRATSAYVCICTVPLFQNSIFSAVCI